MNSRSAIAAIRKHGALLVFPIGNQKEPASLWSHFHPRSEMRWEWDEDGDHRVADLWHLKTALSTTREVVYTKWYQGRATYFSRELFTALLCALNGGIPGEKRGLSSAALRILETLESESPLSTKELKRMTGLKGRDQETAYSRALKELWSRMLIVAFGEVDDGAFPSLAIGSTRVLFEDLWSKASKMKPESARAQILEALPEKNLFLKFFLKLEAGTTPSVSSTASSESKRSGKASSVPSEVRFSDLN